MVPDVFQLVFAVLLQLQISCQSTEQQYKRATITHHSRYKLQQQEMAYGMLDPYCLVEVDACYPKTVDVVVGMVVDPCRITELLATSEVDKTAVRRRVIFMRNNENWASKSDPGLR